MVLTHSQAIDSTWTVQNGNWSTAGSWDSGVPNGIDHIARIRLNLTANRTATIDGGIPGSNVTLGSLIMGDTAGNQSLTIAGGTITFDVSSGNASVTMENGGNNVTIQSDIVFNDRVDFLINDASNNQGIILHQNGVKSGGTNGTVTMSVNDGSAGGMNWLLLRGNNTFEGQVLIESGTLRLETNTTAGGAVGVGNEIIVQPGGSIDLRNLDLNISGQDDTQIVRVAGFGYAGNGNGAIRNTSGTATLSHLILDGDASYGGYSRLNLSPYTDSGSATVYPIFDMGGNEFTKTGTGDFVLGNATIANAGTINVREGELRLENLSGNKTNETRLDGLTVNIIYNRNPLDTTTFVGSDPSQGNRTSDPFNPNNGLSATGGNTIIPGRLEFYRQDTTHTGATINLGNGAIQRNGVTTAGVSFDTIIDPTSVINLISGDITNNFFQSDGGAAGLNGASYDYPGALIIQAPIANTGGFDTGTVSGTNAGTGFAIRGSRPIELQNANPNFNGTVLVKQNTGRYLPIGFNAGQNASESQFSSLILSGANGGLTSASTVRLERYGSLMLENDTTTSNNDRLGDTSILDLRNGNLVLEADGVTATENVGNVQLNRGASFFFLDTRDAGSGSDGAVDMTINSISSTNGGMLFLMNPNGGTTFDQNAPVANSGDSRVALTNPAGTTLVGNPTGTTDRGVLLRVLGGVVDGPGGASVTRPDWTLAGC